MLIRTQDSDSCPSADDSNIVPRRFADSSSQSEHLVMFSVGGAMVKLRMDADGSA